MSDSMLEVLADEVERGERTGGSALAALARHGGFLFHGSLHSHSRLEPRRPTTQDPMSGEMIPDGSPAVCCAADPRVAIFMAVMPTAGTGRDRWYSFAYEDGVLVFRATAPSINRRDIARGFVHVVEHVADFVFHERDKEWRMARAVDPVLVVEVTGDDLPTIEVVDS